MRKLNIGTYSFGMDSSISLAYRLEKAREIGYTGIEFLADDLSNNSTKDLRKMLEDNSLECVSLHAGMDLISINIPKMVDLGGKMIICPGYSFSNREEAIDCARLLEKKGREAKKYGIKIGYHNHNNEFFKDEGKPLLSHLIENSDPEYVFFQLDCGWAAAGGADCPGYIKQHSGRFISIHAKENNRIIGAERPRSSRESQRMPAMKIGIDGRPEMTEEMRQMMKVMKERESIQCPMGHPSSRLNWKEVKTALDAQGFESIWVVEREYDYAGNIVKCLAEDVAWLLKNL